MVISLFLARSAAAATDPGDAGASVTPPPLFQKKCAMCHANGEGNAAMAKMLHAPPEKMNLHLSQASAEDIHKLLKSGRNKMPAFGYLTPDQVNEVTSFVLKLRSSAPEKAPS
jgi:mono/diheme cytochrome c family protein